MDAFFSIPECFSDKDSVKKIHRLVARLRTLGHVVNEFEHLLHIDVERFANTRSVGATYVATLKRIQEQQGTFAAPEPIAIPGPMKDEVNSRRISKLLVRLESTGRKIESLNDLLEIDLRAFSKEPGIGVVYVNTLRDIHLACKDRAESETPIFNTHLVSAIGEKKLWKAQEKLASLGLDSTLPIDIAQIDIREFANLKQVGSDAVNELKDIQNYLLDRYPNLLREARFHFGNVDLDAFDYDTDSAYLNASDLNPKQISTIRKIGELFSTDWPSVAEILLFILEHMDQNLTQKFNSTQIDIVLQVGRDLFQSQSAVVVSYERSAENDTLDKTIIQESENYLMQLDDRCRDILTRSIGFFCQKETLKDIGGFHRLSRERVRQITQKHLNILKVSIDVHRAFLYDTICGLGNEVVFTKKFPLLIHAFGDCKMALSFLALLLPEDFSKTVAGRINGEARLNFRILDRLIEITPSPISRRAITEHLLDGNDYTIADTEYYIGRWTESSHLLPQGDDSFIPSQLRSSIAVPHILIEYETGLPWKEIVNILNHRNHLGRQITRVNPCDSEHVMLSGRGTYKHVKHSGLEEHDFDKVLELVIAKLEKNDQGISHLQNIHGVIQMEMNIDYFDLRHICSRYGEDYGVHFDGKSNNDTVSSSPTSDKIDLTESIFGYIKSNASSSSVADINGIMRTKSDQLVALHISKLREDNRIMRMSKGLYVDVERVKNSIDWQVLKEYLKSLLKSSRFVDLYFVKERFNSKQGLSLRHEFYEDFISIHCGETFLVRRGYVSLEVIDFDGTVGLQDKYFAQAKSEAEIMQEILSNVLCSEYTKRKLRSFIRMKKGDKNQE